MMTAAIRFRQGLRALLAFTAPIDRDLAAAHLSPALLALFEQLSRGEQQHSLNVLRDVLAQGQTPPTLAQAALLHDVGKARYRLAVWQKTLAVLIHKFAPAWFMRWSAGDPDQWWMRPFVVYVQHPAWGAKLIASAGASESVVWLVEHHADSPVQWRDHPLLPLLQRLQEADNAN